MRRTSTVLVGIALLVPGCATPPDAGDEAFVAWATVAVLGRRPYDHGEIEALAHLADRRGREAVLDVLMEQPAFVDHWTRLLMEDLQVAKVDGEFSGNERASDPSCYTTEVMSSFHDPALVQHLRTSEITEPFCPGPVLQDASRSAQGVRTAQGYATELTFDASRSRETLDQLAGNRGARRLASPMDGIQSGGVEYLGPTYDGDAPETPTSTRNQVAAPPVTSCNSFTLKDAARASLREDRLDALYRVALIPLATHNTTNGIARSKFLDGWLDRDPGCVECHTTHYSTTNGMPRNGDWDRYYPPFYLDLEGTTFSWTDADALYHDGAAGGDRVADNIRGFFHQDAFASDDGFQPFSMHASCTTQTADNPDRHGFVTTIAPRFDNNDRPINAAMAGMFGNTLGPLDLVDAFWQGAHEIDMAAPAIVAAPVPYLDGLTGDVSAGETHWAQCVSGCHNPNRPVANAPVPLQDYIYDMSASRLYDIVVAGSPAGLMAPQLDEQQGTDLVAYVTSGEYPHSRYAPKVYNDPTVGFAHLTAMTIANHVHEHLRGYPLTLEHRGVRNAQASDRLFELTAHFVHDGWSLRSLVKRIALAPDVNALAPVDAPDADAYGFAMLFEPWADVNENEETVQTVLGEDTNGVGDTVQRWPVASLLSQVQHALFWPEPSTMPALEAEAYGDVEFYREVGGPVNFNDPGIPEMVLTAMLAWEDEIDGCANHSAGEDYVDVITDPEHGLTVRQGMLALKGRLLSDPRFYDGDALGPQDGELQVANGIVNESSTVSSALGVDLDAPASDHVPEIRDYCAALLMSPQFLLAGVPAWDAQHLPPDTDPAVPCVDERCGYDEHCEHYREAAVDVGYSSFSCGLSIEDVLQGG